MGFIVLILFVLFCYPIPLLYCLWLSKKENDSLYKKISFLPVYNILWVVYHYTKYWFLCFWNVLYEYIVALLKTKFEKTDFNKNKVKNEPICRLKC
jgi:hypothetical protein